MKNVPEARDVSHLKPPVVTLSLLVLITPSVWLWLFVFGDS